jgi:hypothetical protein
MKSIHDIWQRVEGIIPKDAVVRILGDCILELLRERQYVRVVRSEDTNTDKSFLVAIYTRGSYPKTGFYTDPWMPVAHNEEGVVSVIAKL